MGAIAFCVAINTTSTCTRLNSSRYAIPVEVAVLVVIEVVVVVVAAFRLVVSGRGKWQ